MKLRFEQRKENPLEISRIQSKLSDVLREVNEIGKGVGQIIETKMPKSFSFQIRTMVARDLLTEEEKAQAICFVSRYNHLPVIENTAIQEAEDGKYYFKEHNSLRLLLNEYRSILSNQSDSIHYSKINAYCCSLMKNRDETKGLVLTVLDECDRDITALFLKFLGEHNKAIKFILAQSNFGYLYNGILQHSDQRYAHQMLLDYASGEINYVFYKHCLLCKYAKDLLSWHFKIISQFTYPALGGL